jgi:succinoglycan biosynthesis protein ExoL
MSAPSVLMLINTTGLQYDDRLRKEAGSLQALGLAVSILALEYANRARQSLVYDGVPATTIRLRSRRWFPQSRGLVVKTAEMYLRFVAFVIRRRPDVVWCHDLEMGGLVPLLAALRALGLIRRIVWDQHELPSDRLRGTWMYRGLFGWLLNRCDSVIMANRERRALVLDWLTTGTAIEILNNFPDARFGELARQPLPGEVTRWLDGFPYLLAQGGANPDRHLDSLVAAVLRATELKLVVVGPFNRKRVDDLEREHGGSLGQRVLFTGPVPQMELSRFIDHAYASVILYQANSDNTQLCAPNRLYQALVRNVPVVVGANPPMADLVRANSCGVVLNGDGGDVGDLSEGLQRLEAGHDGFSKAAAVKRDDLTWESQEPIVARIAGVGRPQDFKTVCLLPVASDARIHRRLGALARLGVEPTVLAFERPYYPGKEIAGGFQSLGRVEHGKYLSRLRPLVSALPKVRSACATADVVYAFSLDLLALAWLATRASRRKPRFVYEVADIHPTLVGRGVRASIMRAVERRLLKDASLLVVTSEAFITGFYKEVQGISGLRYQLVENKPELGALDAPAPRLNGGNGPITIGYFGVIRCERSWSVLRRVAEQGQGRIRVYLRGVPLNIPDFEAGAKECPWIDYAGPYVAPDELAAMYNRIDLLWVAHRVDDNNSLLWNRTNRFYEGCAFQKPMIGQVGTQDGGVVLHHGLGPLIDLADPKAVADRIMNITREEMGRWQLNVSHLPRSIYRENGEHEQLTMQIRALANAT